MVVARALQVAGDHGLRRFDPHRHGSPTVEGAFATEGVERRQNAIVALGRTSNASGANFGDAEIVCTRMT